MAAAPQASSRLEMLQARFQQRQLAEKEQKLLQLYDQQQLRAHQVAQRGSAGSNGSNSSGHGNASHHQTVTRTSTTTHATSNSQGGGGKVRQMFDERRQTTVKGIDKSYPLEPLENRSRKHQTTTTSNVIVNSTSQIKNGNPTSNRRSVVTRRTVRSEANSNVNDGKPVVTYHEEVSREISDSNDRDNEQEEFGDDNFNVPRYANGNRRADRPNQLEIEDVTNENTTQRHRTTAKIHLAEFDRSKATDPESEQFANNETNTMPERLPGRSLAGKKSFQGETRLERPKNSNAKKIGQPIKQVAGNTTSFTKKRNDNNAPSVSTSRASTVTMRMQGEISRGSSKSPELEGSKKSRTSSPEVFETKGKLTNPTGCPSPVTKTSGITRVSQLSHKNSTDFYPRRKSEFEKSKTFRKLQLELGESSPEPDEPKDFPSSVFGTQCRRKSSIFNENINSSGRRSSSSSPVYDEVYSRERKVSHKTSSERPQSRRGSQNSTYRKDSLTKSEDKKTNKGLTTSSFESNIYSSRRRSSSSGPVIDQGPPKGRKESPENSSKHPISHEKPSTPTFLRESTPKKEESKTLNETVKISTLDSSTYSSKHRSTSWNPIVHRDHSDQRKTERSGSPGRSQSPTYSRKSVATKENRRSSTEETQKSSFDSSTHYSRRRSSSSSPFVEHDFMDERKKSYEQSPERPESRGGFSTSNYRRDSLTNRDRQKTKSNSESRTSASRLRSESPVPHEDYDRSEARCAIYEISHDRPVSRGRSPRPTSRRASSTERDEKTSASDSKHFASSTYSSRQHSASPVQSVDRNYSGDRKTSHEISKDSQRSQERSQSLTHPRESIIEQDQRSTGRDTTSFASSTYASRQHASYPIPSAEDACPIDWKTSYTISHESPGSRERSQSPTYRRESTIEHDERSTERDTKKFSSSTFSSRQHSDYSIPSTDHNYPEDRKKSYTISRDGPASQERSESPNYRRESNVEHDQRSIGKETSFASTTFSSRQHAAYPNPSAEDEYFEDQKTSHTMSHEHLGSRERSQSPNRRRESVVEHDQRSIGKDTSFASTTFSSRQHAAYPNTSAEDEYVEDRKTSHTMSHERPRSRERSQSPNYRRESNSEHDQRPIGKETSFASTTFSSRQHAAYPNPSAEDEYFEDQKTSHTMSHEHSGTRERSQSPNRRRESVVEHDQRSIGRDTSFASTTFSSRQHAASPNPSAEDEHFEDQKTSHTTSHEHSGSRERSQSPNHRRESNVEHDQRSIGKDTTFASTTFSSRQHAALNSNPSAEDEYFEDRKTRHTMSHERSGSRERSQSPTYRRGSISEHGQQSSEKETSHYTSSTFSSRQHSDLPISSNDWNYSGDRKTSYMISHEGPGSRERSQSPISLRRSYEKDMNTRNATNGESKTSSYETNTFSSRCHSTFPAPIVDYDSPSEGRTSREKSLEYSDSRRESQSLIHRRESVVKSDDKKASTFASSTFSSRRRSSSSGPIVDYEIPKEQEPNHDRDELISKNRRKSGGNLRSVELIKKLVRPPSPGKRTTSTSKRKSTARKTTLEDIELPTETANLRETMKRAKSPEHKIVKKDKAPTKITKQEKTVKTKVSINSRDSRSRTISPLPVIATKATPSSKIGHDERKTSDGKKTEPKMQQERKEKNLINEKENKKTSSEIGRSRDGKDSRRSSSEIAVKRHDTFKITKPNENIVKIGNGKISKDKEISVVKKNRDEFKDKSQLLERIEKIRSTLSRSGRSEQNLQSNGFERTDSVESALRRFDSIGVETEHHVTVGVDETDKILPITKSEIFYTDNEKKIPVTEEIVVKKTITPLCRPAKTTVAVVQAQPRQVDVTSPILAKGVEKAKSAKAKREKPVTVTTPRNSDKRPITKSHGSQKRVTSMVKKSRLRSEESSGRGEGRQISDSPLCKRKLFEDSESEMENENVRSTIVLTATTRVTNNSPVMMEIERENNRDSMRKSAENVLQRESSFGESKMENEPGKILRSIEDIRKSIKRESQDFKRELNKFNKAMRKNGSTRENPDSIATSGTVSCVQITKTFKSGDREPVVKIEKSVVKLPITHRVAKSPSPDIGTKRSMEGRTKTTTNSVVRRSVPSSPAKTPDSSNRYDSSELRVSGAKSSMRTSSSPGSREMRNQKEFSITTEYSDVVDEPRRDYEITETEIIQTATTKKNNAFVINFNDPDSPESKESALNREELSVGKRPSERSLTSQRQSGSNTIAPSSRPSSALSTTSSAASARGQISQVNSKNKMSTKAKSPSASGPRGNSNPRNVPQATDPNDGLVSCKICSRRFNSDRVARHEQICSKTTTKKRKQFDATIHRVKGTELEPFVKKGGSRKSQADRKTQKPEVKSNWRRKHEEFINAIRSAKQVQAHLAAGGKLSDLPPPPPSDTSDYVQCPHCGRKFNQGAADRHIPKCQTMMHNKPNPRAPPKPKR